MKVKNPRNILKYQSKSLFDLEGGRIMFLIIGLAVLFGIGGLLLLVTPIPIQFCFIISSILAIPCFLSAVLKVSGLYFDEVIKRLLGAVLLNRNYRPYKRGGNEWQNGN